MEQAIINYTNKVTIAANHSKSEVIMNLYQEIPVFDHKSGTSDMSVSTVGSFVMNRQMAEELVRIINSVLGSSEEPETDKE